MAITGGAPALLLAVPERWTAAVVVVATSAAFAVFNVAAVSLRHRLVPEQLFARVVAAWRTVVLGAGAIGALADGAAASAQGLDAAFVLSAVLGAVAVAVWWSAARRQPDNARLSMIPVTDRLRHARRCWPRHALVDDASDVRTLAAPCDRLVAQPSPEVPTVTTSSAGHPVWPGGSGPSVEELFRDTEPVRCAEDLAREGVFAEGEVEEFLADLYAMRRSDVG